MKQEIVKIIARKYDGRIHRQWEAKLLSQTNSLLTFVGVFDEEIVHAELGLIRRGTISYEYYWLDRWYNVFKFFEPDGRLRNFYCNVNLPPTFADRTLDYIDLDIDVLVWSDHTRVTLDLAEFEENAVFFGYPAQVKEKAARTVAELETLIDAKLFPFD